MCPIDPTPHGGEVLHEKPEPAFPQPKPGDAADKPPQGEPRADDDVSSSNEAPGKDGRPELPEHADQAAVNDPVIDAGEGKQG